MDGFIDNLRLLNRQERFHLLAAAFDNPTLRLGDRFRAGLAQAFNLDVPADAFVAVDYHLTWLYAAAVMVREPDTDLYRAGGGIERGNQPDAADLLVAFESGRTTHVLILEAKGVVEWSHKQLLLEAVRLGDVFGFGAKGNALPGIEPHFAIVSPFKPTDLEIEEWPLWLTDESGDPTWLQMPIPADFVKIVRTDPTGKPNGGGSYWRPELDHVASRQALPESPRRRRSKGL